MIIIVVSVVIAILYAKFDFKIKLRCKSREIVLIFFKNVAYKIEVLPK